MDAERLLDAVFDVAPTRDPEAALSLGVREWPAMSARAATAEDAETCRLLAVSAAALGRFADAATWRRRAILRAAAVGWPELIAAVLMSEAFIALARANDDYVRGHTLDVIVGVPATLDILDELEPFATGAGSGIVVTPRSPSPALIRRFVVEKRGSFLLALGRWEDAAASFHAAVSQAEGPRGALKARAGLALARYRRGLDEGDDAAIEAALAETMRVADEGDETGDEDLVSAAGHNRKVMARRGVDLLLYEIL